MTLTKLQLGKVVRRECDGVRVFSSGKERNVIVELAAPGLIGCRLKGTRATYWLPADAVYWVAMKTHLAAMKRQKAAERKQKGKE